MKNPILIVGAGPTGLALAITLSRYQIPVRIIDQEISAHTQSRALGVHSKTMEVFHNFGIADEILKNSLQIKYLNLFFQKEKKAEIDMGVLKAPYPFITIIPQSITERILIEKLHQLGVRVERGSKLISLIQTDEFVEGEIESEEGNKETFKSPWVIGCEGAHSLVRKAIGADFMGHPYETEYVLADIQMDSNLGMGSLNLFADLQGAIVVLPIKEGLYRIVSQKVKGVDPSHTTIHHLEEMISKRALGDNKIIDIQWISDFKISHRQASKYRNQRLFVAGDSAHIHSPAGGQGLNTGVQDAFNLGWKIAYVHKYHAGKKLLASYSRERITVGKKVLSLTDKLTKIATVTSPLKLKYYSCIIQMINRVNLFKKRIAYQLSGISIRYKKSPIIKKQKRFLFFIPAITAGCRLSDGHFIHLKEKKETQLFDLVCDKKHHLFLFVNKKRYLKAKSLKTNLEKKHPEILKVHLITSDENLIGEDLWLDKKGLSTKPYCLRSPFMVMVRPDRYIGMTQRGLKEVKIKGYFQDLLGLF